MRPGGAAGEPAVATSTVRALAWGGGFQGGPWKETLELASLAAEMVFFSYIPSQPLLLDRGRGSAAVRDGGRAGRGRQRAERPRVHCQLQPLGRNVGGRLGRRVGALTLSIVCALAPFFGWVAVVGVFVLFYKPPPCCVGRVNPVVRWFCPPTSFW